MTNNSTITENNTITEKYCGNNWMKGISGEKLISNVNIPGTHDSGTKNLKIDIKKKDIKKKEKIIKEKIKKYQCQNLSIDRQMEIGVRYFDIRCVNKEDRGDMQYIYHSSVPCLNERGEEMTLDEIIQIGKNFLKKNPTETLIYQIKNEGGRDNNKRLCNYLGKYIKNSEIWSNNYIPHLYEVRGKIVLVRRFSFEKHNTFNITEDKYGINLDSWWNFVHFFRIKLDTFIHMNDIAWVQDRYPVKSDEKYGLIGRAIEEMNNSDKKPSKEWAICLSSCTKPTPIDAANEINRKLLSPQSSPFNNKKKLGTFIVDFATEELIRKIYMSNLDLHCNN